MTIRRKVTDRQQAIMVHMRVKRQHPRWTLLHDPHAGMTMAMHPAFVAFGTLEATLQVHIVGGKIRRLASDKQPWPKLLIIVAKCWWTGSGLDCHACCSAMNRASRSSSVAVALGLSVSSTACRFWAQRPTCSKTSRETSSPRSIQPASRFNS
ncbi:MAG TPA: hypothetical protein VLQ80_18670, partial [Candidatus Saccharimonadia bacterium]|nr:hypothetical protein [Candidatus Saccharimonadia bacterium]